MWLRKLKIPAPLKIKDVVWFPSTQYVFKLDVSSCIVVFFSNVVFPHFFWFNSVDISVDEFLFYDVIINSVKNLDKWIYSLETIENTVDRHIPT